MKKFYAFAAAAVAALSMNAQTLYICGAGDGLAWTPTAPMEVELENGAYTFDIDNLTQFKISTAIGEPAEGDTDGWGTYNAAAKTCTYTEDDLGNAVALEEGDANIGTPWKGLYHIVVAGDLSTITMTTTTEKPIGFTPLYVRGGMTADWGAYPEWQFSTEDGVTYTFVCTGETVIPAGVEFKIADADWDKYNFTAGGIVTVDDYSYWFAGNDNSTMAEDFEGTITFKLPGEGETEAEVYFDTTVNAVSAIEATNAPAEYFNLQGVRVANPENGLYIVRQGSKVTKQVIR